LPPYTEDIKLIKNNTKYTDTNTRFLHKKKFQKGKEKQANMYNKIIIILTSST